MLQSIFISYGTPDASFARKLRDDLHRNGVRTFFFETDAIPGDRLHEVMRNGVNEHDRVVLICSSSSLMRKGVRNEIQETLAREARDGGASYLIPVTIDDFIFGWSDPIALAIRDRVVADFRSVRTDEDAYSRGLRSLIVALRRRRPGA